ncbi:hypothetical protein SpCBS45565_g07856 [Spizellomyces sp. 'palustris']|nr:hypothetical protein SpCBS45565_g07856 [Spizellomyces sp. 'palustris']
MAQRKPAQRKTGSIGARLVRWGTIIVTSYLVLLLALVSYPQVFQPHLIYLNWVRYPSVNWSGDAQEFGFRAGTVRSIKFSTPDNVTLGAWHILPRTSAPSVLSLTKEGISPVGKESVQDRDTRFTKALQSAGRVFLYFHGNAGNRATGHRTDFYKIIQVLGENTHIIAVDCRGFGDSDGYFASEQGIQIDAVASFDWIVAQGVSPAKIVVVGHSLGTGIATYLAHNITVSRGIRGGGLLLLAGYASIPDAALGYPMVPLLWPFKHHPSLATKAKSFVVERWESSRNIRDTHGWPVLLVHGSRDYEILPWQARNLFLQAVSARIGREAVEPPEDVVTALAPDHEGSSHLEYEGYDIRTLPGREAWLWTLRPNKDADAVVRGPKDIGNVWYLEVKHGGHNSLSRFHVVPDTIDAWATINGL